MLLPMPLLRMRDATFDDGAVRAGPVMLEVHDGQRTALTCTSSREARIVALLASAIVKPTSGRVLIGDYDPTVQSVACKRIAAFVPHEPFSLDDREFGRYVAYRAALWNIELTRARARAQLLRNQLSGMHEAFAYPLIAALLGMPKLLVVDRPQPVYAKQILAATHGCAVFSTHADAAAAAAFAPMGATSIRENRA
jgi:hypothetical protein